ncbi:Oidioi.mRNA.OKI2018_I69.chr1.g678.t1.cds [Oikopleura dioica]|uniref:Oidioi.mRNA.OKI2018_I69.chr1.g678.t1.cds n=1 Tax=Oikopleura dioica TaxID=34765 RepID=A0ABN7SSS2_OIKDI|nr:Oidioi.mRNA.OKI2018_I69.chr1.g678.t1.cds [Oikopleura dioica]
MIFEEINNDTIAVTFYEAQQNVLDTYSHAEHQFKSDIWRDPRLLFSYFKRPVGDETEKLVLAADMYTHSLDLIKNSRKNPRRVRRERVDATDQLSREQQDALVAFTGCRVNDISRVCPTDLMNTKYQQITGTCNNQRNSHWGASNMPQRRVLPSIYEDNISLPVGIDPAIRYAGGTRSADQTQGQPLPLVRAVSNSLARVAEADVISDIQYTHLLTVWGQYIDHDLGITPQSKSISSFQGNTRCESTCENLNPCFPIQLPAGDPKLLLGRQCLPFFRSAAICGTGAIVPGGLTWQQPREQVNANTAFLDASTVYGSNLKTKEMIRDPERPAFLKVNAQFNDNGRAYLPFSGDKCVQEVNSTEPDVPCWLAGDGRAAEVIPLASVHTIWVRWHNFLAEKLISLNRHWSQEQVYQETRKIVSAVHQKVTFYDYLPKIIGQTAFDAIGVNYPGYDETIDATVSNVFTTAAFRFGHAAIRSTLFRLNENFQEHEQFKNIPLHKSFFSPWRIVRGGGLDPVLRGLVFGQAKAVAPRSVMNDELREKLFELENKSGFDLASLNLQRGRDHGLPLYGAWKQFCESYLSTAAPTLAYSASTAFITDPDVINRLTVLYGDIDNTDIWIAGLLEDIPTGSRVGPTFQCLLMEQFSRYRTGDRFWFENPSTFSAAQTQAIQAVDMGLVLCETSDIGRVPPDAFVQEPTISTMIPCGAKATMNLDLWREDGTSGSCGALPHPENGFGVFNAQRQVEFFCNPGFRFRDGSRQGTPSTCFSGRWDPPTPMCLNINECEVNNGGCGELSCRDTQGSFECFDPMDNEVREETGGLNTQTRILIIGSVTLGCLVFIGISVIFCYLRRRRFNKVVSKSEILNKSEPPQISSVSSSEVGSTTSLQKSSLK